jgi:two-component system, sporulation sensor kinase D
VADRFSKIGSKSVLEEHSAYAVVKDFVDYFKVRVSKNINFELTGNPHLKAGLNVPLFDWVVENLLKNAVNAIEGKGSIKVEVRHRFPTRLHHPQTGLGFRPVAYQTHS